MTEQLRSHHWSAILTATQEVYEWTDAQWLMYLKHAVKQAELNPVSELVFRFQPQGLSAVVLLEESHVALHFWPELQKVTVDLHVCDYSENNQTKAEKLAQRLAQTFSQVPVQWHHLTLQG